MAPVPGHVRSPAGSRRCSAPPHGPDRVRADPGAGSRLRPAAVDRHRLQGALPAVNDPYTAVQAIEHLAVLLSALAAHPVGDHVGRDATGTITLIVPGRRFSEHLALGVGLLRRYGAAEPTVLQALLRLLDTCAAVVLDDPARWEAIEREARLLVTDAERAVEQADDLAPVHAEAAAVGRALAARRAGRVKAGKPAS